MKTSRGMTGLALLFWGWETGLLSFAVLMALVLEGSQFVRVRWELDDADLNRICDLCLALFIGAGILLFSTEDRMVFIFKFAQWVPFCFFPVAVAQCYGNRDRIPLSAFSFLLRRMPHSPMAKIHIHVSYGYYAACLLGASASTRADQFFYAGISLLILLALGSVRPNRVSWAAWITLAVVVLTVGRLSHQQLRSMQNKVETALGSWLADWLHPSTDPRERHTNIGRPVPMPSSRIVLRLLVPPGQVPPSLLREGAYDGYSKQTWTAGTNEPGPVNMSNGAAFLMTPKKNSSRVEISGYFPDGVGILPLPHGTFELEDFEGVLRTNRLGVADSESGPGLLDFKADYWTGPSFDSPPGPVDKMVPKEEQPALIAVADQLGLDKMSERQKIRAVSRFFLDHFRYTLRYESRGLKGTNTPLARFLLDTHAGHCEYFATATVLLLRQAGVNARYVTGYIVPESARHGDTYLVRERHSHAWALVYHSDTGTWEQIDNTPPGWSEEADSQNSWVQSTTDFMSNLYFQFSKWRWGKTSVSFYAQWALAPLILYLVWRILSTRRRQQNAGDQTAGTGEPIWPGLDSEIYLINKRLAPIHLSRQPHESLTSWQQRVENAFPAAPPLREIFHLHRRLRFDPHGLARDDRETLRQSVTRWLEHHSGSTEKPGSGNSAAR